MAQSVPKIQINGKLASKMPKNGGGSVGRGVRL
jgi:hypothetical protein